MSHAADDSLPIKFWRRAALYLAVALRLANCNYIGAAESPRIEIGAGADATSPKLKKNFGKVSDTGMARPSHLITNESPDC